jgi:hypothetical protein
MKSGQSKNVNCNRVVRMLQAAKLMLQTQCQQMNYGGAEKIWHSNSSQEVDQSTRNVQTSAKKSVKTF